MSKDLVYRTGGLAQNSTARPTENTRRTAYEDIVRYAKEHNVDIIRAAREYCSSYQPSKTLDKRLVPAVA